MINLLKVAGFFQQVPSFNSFPEKITQEHTESTQTNMMSDLFTGRSSKNQGSKKEDAQKGASGQDSKGNGKQGNNKRDDNDDNNGGGMLEPIL
jgi:hypothetical protein